MSCGVSGLRAQTRPPTFDAAAVRPSPPNADPATGSWSPPGHGRFTASHVSLALLLQLAYGVADDQIANRPAWLATALFDVDAKAEDGVALTREELKPRLQQLLAERFHLAAHTELRPVRGYALRVAPGGPHLRPTAGDHSPGFRVNVSPGHMQGLNWSLPQLATYLAPAAGFPVVDQTGLSGSYDVSFTYNSSPEAEDNLAPLSVALKQATGLLLKPAKVPVRTLVLDAVDRNPAAN